ncbi:MAG: TIGR00645 family protein [Alphaproteobacteria bacterium]|nr:TIGR00645 family protein [Alphaproteobacteria bacterium]
MARQQIEFVVESILFGSRWLLVPCYLGLIGAMGMVSLKFVQELVHYLPLVFSLGEDELILAVLSLVDLTLAGNLVLMVILSGYENTVSTFDIGEEHDRPAWLGKISFGGLKLKLIASMVAISGIHLLKFFMNIEHVSKDDLKWMVVLHLVFIVSGVLMALMDWIKEKSHLLVGH